jgi:hypothetical protein
MSPCHKAYHRSLTHKLPVRAVATVKCRVQHKDSNCHHQQLPINFQHHAGSCHSHHFQYPKVLQRGLQSANNTLKPGAHAQHTETMATLSQTARFINLQPANLRQAPSVSCIPTNWVASAFPRTGWLVRLLIHGLQAYAQLVMQRLGCHHHQQQGSGRPPGPGLCAMPGDITNTAAQDLQPGDQPQVSYAHAAATRHCPCTRS